MEGGLFVKYIFILIGQGGKPLRQFSVLDFGRNGKNVEETLT